MYVVVSMCLSHSMLVYVREAVRVYVCVCLCAFLLYSVSTPVSEISLFLNLHHFQAPSSLLQALEQHLASLEGKKIKELSSINRYPLPISVKGSPS